MIHLFHSEHQPLKQTDKQYAGRRHKTKPTAFFTRASTNASPAERNDFWAGYDGSIRYSLPTKQIQTTGLWIKR